MEGSRLPGIGSSRAENDLATLPAMAWAKNNPPPTLAPLPRAMSPSGDGRCVWTGGAREALGAGARHHSTAPRVRPRSTTPTRGERAWNLFTAFWPGDTRPTFGRGSPMTPGRAGCAPRRAYPASSMPGPAASVGQPPHARQGYPASCLTKVAAWGGLSACQDCIDDPLDVQDVDAAITVRIGPGQDYRPSLEAQDDIHHELDVEDVHATVLVDIIGAGGRRRGGGRPRCRRR